MTDRPDIEELIAARLAERLESLHEHLEDQPLTHADSQDMVTLREASEAITALIDAYEAVKAERDEARFDRAWLRARAEAAEARVAELAKALREIADSPLSPSRISAHAEAALAGKEEG